MNTDNEVNLAEVGWDLVLMVNELLHAVQLVDESSAGDWPVLPRKGMSKHELMHCICAAMEHHARVLLQLRSAVEELRSERLGEGVTPTRRLVVLPLPNSSPLVSVEEEEPTPNGRMWQKVDGPYIWGYSEAVAEHVKKVVDRWLGLGFVQRKEGD